MKCPRCGAENLDERVYCWKCMAPLRSGAMGPLPRTPTREAQPGAPAAPIPYAAEGKGWLAAALLTWFLGVLWVDRFLSRLHWVRCHSRGYNRFEHLL